MDREAVTLDAQFDARRRRMLINADPRPLLWIALGVMLFNVWDRWLDAPRADHSLLIRLGCATLLALCCWLLRRPGIAERHALKIYAAAFLGGIWGVALAILPLDQGFALACRPC